VIANLFLHYAFDAWLAREFPAVRFERYVDDAVIHCVSQAQAQRVLAALRERMEAVGLVLHPDKTRIVYCADGKRRGSYEHTAFTFLGYTFRARGARRKDGARFTAFMPAISKDALKKISAEVRSWRLDHRTGHTEAELARKINPIIRLDELLRCILPIGALLPPGTDQRIPTALVPQQVPKAQGTQEGAGSVEPGGKAPPPVLRPLGLGDLGPCRLVTRTTRAV
jgi:hypothetical protein